MKKPGTMGTWNHVETDSEVLLHLNWSEKEREKERKKKKKKKKIN